ncbi:MAG TPA: DUF5916 domain-containing protein [Candidatus Eisenbacteria bacterium]
MRPHPRTLLVALGLGLLPYAAHAAGRPGLVVARASGALQIDGVLDEPAWRTAGIATAFELIGPREGQAPDESTTVRVLRDEDRVVFGIWCQAKRAPHAGLAPRDQVLDGDHISLHLDTDGDGQRAYIFGVNPWGVQLDGILTGDPDFKWDGVWEAAAKRGASEWTAEIAVPFRILRVSANGRPWRLWVRRELTAWNEVAAWPIYRVGQPGPIMLQAGDLSGLDDARGGRQFTLEPYLFGAGSGDRAQLPSGGYSGWSDQAEREAGVDVQAAPTRSLVVNATLNPDFSQIEADALQIDVNRRFPLVFPEKRPFFLEGADHFQSLMDLVLTRRMADPRWGAKLTGRAGPWNTGALLVRDEGGATLEGSGFTPGDDHRLSRPGWYGLARAQLPFGRGANVGVLAGAHTQDGEPALAAVRERETWNVFGGFDSQLRLSEHWTSEGQLVASGARIDSAGVGRRPKPFESWMGVWRARYRDRARQLDLGVRHVGEKFRDELGTQDFAGVTYRHVAGTWDLFPKTGPLQRTAPIVDLLVVHDHTGRLELTELESSADFEFRRSTFVNAGYQHRDEHWLTRTYAEDRAHLFAQWTAWRPLSFDLDANVGDGILFGTTDATSGLAWRESYTLNATVRPEPRLTVAANVVRFRLARAPGGSDYFALWLVGVNTSAQFTRRLSVRVYPQYDGNVRHFTASTLLGYVVQPGTVFYAGVNSGWDRELVTGTRHVTSRQVFAKASWRFAR